MIFAHIRHTFADAFFPRLSEWVPAAVILYLGWLLTRNPDLMNGSNGRGYTFMLTIAAQSTWATAFYAFGTVRLSILLINGAWRRSPLARAVVAALSCFLWTQIVLSFAPIQGFAYAMATGFLAMDFINAFRAMRDARTVDDAYRARRKPRDAS